MCGCLLQGEVMVEAVLFSAGSIWRAQKQKQKPTVALQAILASGGGGGVGSIPMQRSSGEDGSGSGSQLPHCRRGRHAGMGSLEVSAEGRGVLSYELDYM